MLRPIFNNLQDATTATGTSKSTFYRWLSGTTPHLDHLAHLDRVLNISISITYMFKFINTAKQLAQFNEIAKVSEFLSTASLDDEDKALLGDYHKKRIWKNQKTLFSDMEDFS